MYNIYTVIHKMTSVFIRVIHLHGKAQLLSPMIAANKLFVKRYGLNVPDWEHE